MTQNTTTQAQPVSDMTIEEMTESLTGFDEIAIRKHFDGFNVYAEAEANPVDAVRALAFVDQRRRGKTDPEAREHALGLTFREAMAYFADADEDLDKDAPESESGKDDSSPA